MTTTTAPTAATGPDRCPLPSPRGPLSEAMTALLTGAGRTFPRVADADPYGEDLQLALALSHELVYRGVAGVEDDLEWDPAQLAARAEMQDHFLAALRADVAGGDDLDDVIEELLVEPADGEGVSHHFARDGEAWQFREYVAHRSHYHRKEADPQSWVVPRLQGAAKSGLVSVQNDEYGAGRGARMHSTLYADMMAELDLDPTYGAYLERTPWPVLAEVNLQTTCGLRRSLRGAAVGQFAVIELTSSPASARLVQGIRRMGLGPATEHFYAEHVEADAVHEQVLRRDVLRPLLELEPGLARDVVFGIQATEHLGGCFAAHALPAWREGRTSLLALLT